MLNNPFYTGLIKMMTTGETFDAAHEPLVSTKTFERVQAILRGKTNARTKPWKYDVLFRRRVNCAGCGRRLIAELRKGNVYYRCHHRQCPVRCVREEIIQETVRTALSRLQFTDQERSYLDYHVNDLTRHWKRHAEDARAGSKAPARQACFEAREADGCLSGWCD